MANPPNQPPHLLIIRDGWGTNPHPEHDAFNAVKLAKTPVADRLMAQWPWTMVKTCGEDVGLDDGTMGNSEVGHQNIGAGRVVYQDSVRITLACREQRLHEARALTDAIMAAKADRKAVHLMGICSDAGVHGQIAHLEALILLCKEWGHTDVYIHLFTDGRDTGPFSGKAFAEKVERFCAKVGVGRVVSVVGRYWAMDRDNRWERVKRAYDLLTGRVELKAKRPPNFPTAADAVQAFYDKPESDSMAGDEFVTPRTVGPDPEATRITGGDAVIFYNYRGDRPRELCSAFLLPEFYGAQEIKPSPDTQERGFDRGDRLDLHFVLMTPYSERLAELAPVAFPKPPKMEATLGEHVSALGLRQFRCAETEKFPHVTFFFNDYRDDPFAGESREIVQSPKVATYDLEPQMSARGVADAALARLRAHDCEHLLIVNFANADMVGHTGSLQAAVRACETVDALVGELVEACLARGGSCIVTADHGNAEQMFDPQTNAPHTAHTIYDVPLIVIGEAFRGRALRGDRDHAGFLDPALRTGRGRLADIAPTCLEMMGLPQPKAMTGRSLLMAP